MMDVRKIRCTVPCQVETVEGGCHCAETRAEIERLRAALERIASLDVPRPVGHTFRADGVASKHDKCWHGVTMSDECDICLSNYARAALEVK